MKNETIEKLKKLANRECWCESEEFVPYEHSGGNYDDAFYGGYADGECMLARQILEELKIDWK